MTKKELLENEVFNGMPDNTEIVFNTSIKGDDCRPLMMDDISFRSEIVGWAQRDMLLREQGIDQKDPIYRYFIVINTNPY